MLRHNTDLKSWYRTYAKKIEATKSEESFSMTLRQVWRFLRDCQVNGSDCTLSAFDRVYYQGKKNHFTLLGASEMSKFDYLYGINAGDTKKVVDKKKVLDDDTSSSEDSDEEENQEELHKKLGIEPDDIHHSQKVVLQRQFFEAIVRAAMVKYSNNEELTTLSQKLDHLFKYNLIPLAGKNKAKSVEEEVSKSPNMVHLIVAQLNSFVHFKLTFHLFLEKLQDRSASFGRL